MEDPPVEIQKSLPKKRNKRRRWLIGLALLVAIGAVTAYFVARWANTPVVQSLNSVDSQAAQPTPGDQTVQTRFFSFKLPANFHVQISADTTNPNLVHVVAFTSRTSSQQVGITSNLLPSDGLPGVADYNLRRTTSAEYQIFALAGQPAGSTAFHRIDGTPELSVFLVHGSRYASVALSGASDTDLQVLFAQINVQWQWL